MNKDKEIAGAQPALRQQAEEQLKKNGLIPDMLSSKEELQRIVHELSVHQIELEMQKEELLHSRDQLEEALTKYTDLYDFAPLGYLTLSADSTILGANLTAAKLLGIDRAPRGKWLREHSRVPVDHFRHHPPAAARKGECWITTIKKSMGTFDPLSLRKFSRPRFSARQRLQHSGSQQGLLRFV